MVKASMEHENQADLEPQGDIDFERQNSVGYRSKDGYFCTGTELSTSMQASFLVGCSKLGVPPTSVRMPKQVLKSLVSKGVSAPA